MESDIKPVFIGSREVSRILGISRKTVLVYARTGKIPAAFRMPSGYYRFRKDEIERLRKEWIRQRVDYIDNEMNMVDD